MEVHQVAQDAWEATDAEMPDRRFRPLLDLYLCLYERFYPLLAAPLVAAHVLLDGKAPVSEFLEADGRVRLRTVEKLEVDRGYPRGLLTGGLSRHLRNSIAHGRYVVLSRDGIQMEDRDQKGTVTWGPVTYVYYELREQVFGLLSTCEALLTTWILFDVNNAEVIRARGYVVPTRRPLRLDVLTAHIKVFAGLHGFVCKSVAERTPNELIIRLRIGGERADTPEEIYVGGEGWVNRYRRQVTTEDAPVRNQVYSVLQYCHSGLESYARVTVELEGSDAAILGKIVTEQAARSEIFAAQKSIEEVRALLNEDSLPEGTMPVIQKGISLQF